MKKTARDLLLARHSAAVPKLDSIRHSVLADRNSIPTSKLLSALFSPNRKLWIGLAAAWVIILNLIFTQPTQPQPDAQTERYLASWSANQANLYAILSETRSHR